LLTDHLVIGAGALGLATAIELAVRGERVCVLEQGAAGQESTWAGGGILSPLLPWQYDHAVNALSEFSRGLFAEWSDRLRDLSGVDPEYRLTGMLVLPPFDLELAGGWCAKHGWRCETRPVTDVLPDMPAEADSLAAQALWLPGVAQARNPRLARALRGAALACGVNLLEGERVIDIAASGGRIRHVATVRGHYAAANFIIAAGAWSGTLPGLAYLRQRIEPVRGQMLLFKTPVGMLQSVVYRDGRYLIPRADGHLLAGSTLERVGFDKRVSDTAAREIHEFAAGLLPALRDARPMQHWSGLRPGSPGNLPAIGVYPGYENLYVNSGHFRYGLTLAPGSARLLTALIHDETPPLPAEPYQINSACRLNGM